MNSKPVPPHRVCNVVSKLANSIILGANVSIGGRAHCMRLEIIPKAISIRTTTPIAHKYIVRVRDPKASRCHVGDQQSPSSFGLHDQVVFDVVVGFNSILYENCVTLNFIGNIVFKSQVMGSVQSESPVIALMSRKTFSI